MKQDRKRILTVLEEIAPVLLEKYGVMKIGIFGSVARDQAVSSSDVDIVVEMRPDLFKRVCLKAELESILGKKVDVIRYRHGMNRLLKKRIDSEGLYA